MKTTPKRKRRGFTLIEMSVAIMMGLAIGTMILALFNQQLAFLKIFKAQGFLTEEAPIVSTYVSRLVGKADRFRLHDSVADALSGANPRLTESPVAVLNFRQPDGTMRATILSFENRGSGLALYYYVVPVTGVLGEPLWAVTKAPSKVAFRMDSGVLRMILTGPNLEEIIYSGTMQQ
ncbi:MAG: prepilin-type N-terminal cleavage/methylation domain-containing protein [Verrucomicrobiota bacterium]